MHWWLKSGSVNYANGICLSIGSQNAYVFLTSNTQEYGYVTKKEILWKLQLHKLSATVCFANGNRVFLLCTPWRLWPTQCSTSWFKMSTSTIHFILSTLVITSAPNVMKQWKLSNMTTIMTKKSTTNHKALRVAKPVTLNVARMVS